MGVITKEAGSVMDSGIALPDDAARKCRGHARWPAGGGGIGPAGPAGLVS
jgi:hypothetical protein